MPSFQRSKRFEVRSLTNVTGLYKEYSACIICRTYEGVVALSTVKPSLICLLPSLQDP